PTPRCPVQMREPEWRGLNIVVGEYPQAATRDGQSSVKSPILAWQGFCQDDQRKLILKSSQCRRCLVGAAVIDGDDFMRDASPLLAGNPRQGPAQQLTPVSGCENQANIAGWRCHRKPYLGRKRVVPRSFALGPQYNAFRPTAGWSWLYSPSPVSVASTVSQSS